MTSSGLLLGASVCCALAAQSEAKSVIPTTKIRVCFVIAQASCRTVPASMLRLWDELTLRRRSSAKRVPVRPELARRGGSQPAGVRPARSKIAGLTFDSSGAPGYKLWTPPPPNGYSLGDPLGDAMKHALAAVCLVLWALTAPVVAREPALFVGSGAYQNLPSLSAATRAGGPKSLSRRARRRPAKWRRR